MPTQTQPSSDAKRDGVTGAVDRHRQTEHTSGDGIVDTEIAILGAGFAGMCMAIGLLKAGRTDFVIYEKADSLGGTWRDNTYPGCACDVPSQLYSYSFAQHAGWSRTFAKQPEILAYMKQVAQQHNLDAKIELNAQVTAIQWDQSQRLWRLTFHGGRCVTARVVVSGVGGLHLPKTPALPGLESFAGPAFHSARWRHEVDLTGKTVAVIGTGASAIQFIPEIAGTVGTLHVFQRTPPWVLPRNDRPTSRLARWAFARVPLLQRLWRAVQYWNAESIALGFTLKPKLMGRGQKRSATFLKSIVKDPVLHDKLMPMYTMGCKRVLISDDFYATMTRENVNLITDRIAEVRPHSILTADGIERPVDVIIYATGFQPFHPAADMQISGRDNRTLAADWHEGPEAFYGVAVAGYPNYFMLMGPNSGLGHNSILFMIETQVQYILQCLAWLATDRLDTIEVREDVQRAFNDSLQKKFDKSVWKSDGSVYRLPCTSWYVHASGKHTALWPSFSATYWLAMRRADSSHYLPRQLPKRLPSEKKLPSEAPLTRPAPPARRVA